MSEIKIFKVGDCDWIAAVSPEEALEYFNSEISTAVMAEVSELTSEEMDTNMFSDDVPQWDEEKEEYVDSSSRRPFRAQLEKMVQSKEQFPCHFASTEW